MPAVFVDVLIARPLVSHEVLGPATATPRGIHKDRGQAGAVYLVALGQSRVSIAGACENVRVQTAKLSPLCAENIAWLLRRGCPPLKSRVTGSGWACVPHVG